MRRLEEVAMLKELRCTAQLPVQDLARARRWYSEMPGLEPALVEDKPFTTSVVAARGSPSTSGSAGVSEQTVMLWLTPDIERDRGVTFESYDFPGLTTDENDIAQLGTDRVAWFEDSEGNTLALKESGPELLRHWERGPG